MAAGSRSTLTLGSLMLLGFAAAMVVHFFSAAGVHTTTRGAVEAISRALPQHTAFDPAPTVTLQAQPLATRAPPKKPKVRVDPQIARSLGEASGKIHFEGAGEDLQLQSSIGVWLPGQNTVRIVLFESAPQAASLAELLDAIRSGSLHTVAERVAYIDMHFSSSAQILDNNAVDSARLTAIDGAAVNTVNAFSNIEWVGRLLSPQDLPSDGPTPKISMKASRESLDPDEEPGRPSWQFALNAPVITRD